MATKQNLGAILAATAAEEESKSVESARRAAAAKSAEELADFQAVERYFDAARDYFTGAILAKKPTKQLFLTVGRNRGVVDMTKPDGTQLYSVIAGYQYSNNQPNSMQGRGRFVALWEEFKAWAAESGLEASWEYNHDGVGVESWWEVRVRPAGPKPSPAASGAARGRVRKP